MDLKLYYFKKTKSKLGVVAHACNPIYLGGGDKKDHGYRLALALS
jgi:hypothetical protein